MASSGPHASSAVIVQQLQPHHHDQKEKVMQRQRLLCALVTTPDLSLLWKAKYLKHKKTQREKFTVFLHGVMVLLQPQVHGLKFRAEEP